MKLTARKDNLRINRVNRFKLKTEYDGVWDVAYAVLVREGGTEL